MPKNPTILSNLLADYNVQIITDALGTEAYKNKKHKEKPFSPFQCFFAFFKVSVTVDVAIHLSAIIL